MPRDIGHAGGLIEAGDIARVPAKKLARRSRAENKERAYVAASRRPDRGAEARMSSALIASKIHKQRTGRSLVITEEIVFNDQAYVEEEDPLVRSYREHISRIQAQSDSSSSASRASLVQQVSRARCREAGKMAECTVGFSTSARHDTLNTVSLSRKDNDSSNNRDGNGNEVDVPGAVQLQLPQNDLYVTHDPVTLNAPLLPFNQTCLLLFEPTASLLTAAVANVGSLEGAPRNQAPSELRGCGSWFCYGFHGGNSRQKMGGTEEEEEEEEENILQSLPDMTSIHSYHPSSSCDPHSPFTPNPASPGDELLLLPFDEALWDASQVEAD